MGDQPPNACGARLAATPISRPPAEPPRAISRRGAGPALAHQMPGAGGEVGERVRLAEHLAVVVPAAAHLAAAPDVRDGEDEAAVEQRQPADREVGVRGHLVASVAVEDARRASVARCPFPADQGDGDAGAVGGGRPLAVLLVVRGVVPALAGQREHRLALEQGELAGAEVGVVDRVRRGQRGVMQPVHAGAVLGLASGAPGTTARGRRSRAHRPRRR